MKKVLPIFIIVILIGVLAFEIVKFTHKNSQEVSTSGSNNLYTYKQPSSDEKTIDLHGTFSQNDLEINKEIFKVDGCKGDIDLLQIKGLKDKKIEKKINDEIRNTTKSLIESDVKAGFEVSGAFLSAESNFSNILSVKIYDYGDYCSNFIGLNYNLANGEKLNFEDLFKKDENVLSIVRQIFYKGVFQQEEYERGESRMV